MLTLACVPWGAAAAADGDAAPQELAGLFMQSCLPFAGDPDGLRGWAKGQGLHELPTLGQLAFLRGVHGVVFDASNQTGKLVVISQDGGGCSAVAERTDGVAAIADLEQDLRQAGIGFALKSEVADSEERMLRHREYTASTTARRWVLLVSTVQDAPAAVVMLTATAE